MSQMTLSQNFLIRGVQQQVYLRLARGTGRKSILFLHGGPGWADAPWAHVTCHDLWDHVNTIHWDQRGSNHSSLPLGKVFSIEDLILDTIELLNLLSERYQIVKPLLVGHSWGSALGAWVAKRNPELLKGLVGVGQLVANHESEPLSWQYCIAESQKKGRSDLFEELQTLGPHFYRTTKSLYRQREILFELGGEFFSGMTQKQYMNLMDLAPKEFATSKERLISGCELSCDMIWNELIERNLRKDIQTFDVPFYLFQGRHDYCTSSKVAEEWFLSLNEGRGKQSVWFESSGHWPQLEEPQKFTKELLAAAHD